MSLAAPFPWFGGKRKVAPLVWQRFGDVRNYVEPFFGSGAALLGRPEPFTGNETINDLDGYVANFWRAVKLSPDAVAQWADNPVNENDLHARHVWLLQQRESLRPRLEGDPEWHDAKIAGWWVWGIACWIGSGFCSGRGPWWIDEHRQLVHLGDNGQGVNRQLVHLSNNGQGVNRQLVHLGDNGRGEALADYFQALSDRLRRVRVCSGDWSRVCGPSVTFKHGLTAVFLDPPYADTAKRASDLYREDCEQVAHGVREWAIANGENPLLRIALCGYEGEHQMPETWQVVEWSAGQGFNGQAKIRTENGKRERIWFSPHCLSDTTRSLLDAAG
jgi:site-specific DNA-adenine methylase